MKIVEMFYEVDVETYYKKTARVDTNRAGHSRQMRGEAVLSKTYSDMGRHAGKQKLSYVYHPIDQLKLACLIHVPGNS